MRLENGNECKCEILIFINSQIPILKSKLSYTFAKAFLLTNCKD